MSETTKPDGKTILEKILKESGISGVSGIDVPGQPALELRELPAGTFEAIDDPDLENQKVEEIIALPDKSILLRYRDTDKVVAYKKDTTGVYKLLRSLSFGCKENDCVKPEKLTVESLWNIISEGAANSGTILSIDQFQNILSSVGYNLPEQESRNLYTFFSKQDGLDDHNGHWSGIKIADDAKWQESRKKEVSDRMIPGVSGSWRTEDGKYLISFYKKPPSLDQYSMVIVDLEGKGSEAFSIESAWQHRVKLEAGASSDYIEKNLKGYQKEIESFVKLQMLGNKRASPQRTTIIDGELNLKIIRVNGCDVITAQIGEQIRRLGMINRNIFAGLSSYCPVDKRLVVEYIDDRGLIELRLINISSENPLKWTDSEKIPFFSRIEEMRADPNGNYVVIFGKEQNSNDNFIWVINKDSRKFIKIEKASGNNIAVTLDGEIIEPKVEGKYQQLTGWSTNFTEIEHPTLTKAREEEERRKEFEAKKLASINVMSILQTTRSAATNTSGAKEEAMSDLSNYHSIQQQVTSVYESEIVKADSSADLQNLRQDIASNRPKLENSIISAVPSLARKPELARVIDFCLEPTLKTLADKQKEVSSKEGEEATKRVEPVLALVRETLGKTLSLAGIGDMRQELSAIQPLKQLIATELRNEITTLEKDLDRKAAEAFRTKEQEIVTEVRGLLERTNRQLESLDSLPDFDRWREDNYPHLRIKLGQYQTDCPPECELAWAAITEAKKSLQKLADEKEGKMKQDYARMREKAANRIGEMAALTHLGIVAFVERLDRKGFDSRSAAEQWVTSNQEYQNLLDEIDLLGTQDEQRANELSREMKVSLANAFVSIDQQKRLGVAASGQQYVMLGKESFPKWEAKVKHKGKREIKIGFTVDERTKGPGIGAKDMFGDITLEITSPTGKKSSRRLFEGESQEDDYRYESRHEWRGLENVGSYISQGDFIHVKKNYSKWEKGTLKLELKEQRKKLKEIYARAPKLSEKAREISDEIRVEYTEALKEYAIFCQKNQIALMRRIDFVKKSPVAMETNGKGYVPEWSSHWVLSEETEGYLEKMASHLKMQSNLKEGLLNLKGHAGTGKDVLVKMFCHYANRPYFALDCTRWTTEAELGEDIQIEGGDTVRVPSIVIQAITTPGAVLYFNELNAMPEQAQLFLHALFDEKRSVTLKTSAGKTIKADPSTLFMSSMNPDYPGTFKPQFATRSRMVDMNIDYPPLKKKSPSGDSDIYNSSEPMMIARSVDSLSDLTIEPDLERNDFVQVWNAEVNNIGTKRDLSWEQHFDLETLKSLVQFGNKLRERFTLKYDDPKAARGGLEVEQPTTLREMRRCAWKLSSLSEEDKRKRLEGSDLSGATEKLARELLEEYFLCHIDNDSKRRDIAKVMLTWHAQNRV